MGGGEIPIEMKRGRKISSIVFLIWWQKNWTAPGAFFLFTGLARNAIGLNNIFLFNGNRTWLFLLYYIYLYYLEIFRCFQRPTWRAANVFTILGTKLCNEEWSIGAVVAAKPQTWLAVPWANIIGSRYCASKIYRQAIDFSARILHHNYCS